MKKLRVAVIGAGSFGRHHIRVIREMPGVELSAVVDPDERKLGALGEMGRTKLLRVMDGLATDIDAAVVATPTKTHEDVAGALLKAGVDVMVEKPVAETARAGERLSQLAEEGARILQVGHLERFNPAITALQKAVTVPLFFEVHRMSVFTPRSLDIDVVLDLMIHDLDIVLQLAGETPAEIRAAGISVLSRNVDIANVRLAFASGCVANLTASRVSTEKVRKLRLFQPGQYISVDYARQDAVLFAVRNGEGGAATPEIGFTAIPVERGEPLQLELAAFFQSVRDRTEPLVDGRRAVKVLRVAESIVAKIEEHGELVSEAIQRKT